jgi:hypothetical protein
VPDPAAIGSPDGQQVGTVVSEFDPAFDDCSDLSHTNRNALGVLTGTNIGDLLNAAGVTWGWFQGGFRPTGTANGFAVCGSAHTNIGGNFTADYLPHLSPFQYYQSTSNPKHLPPSSVAAIGTTDQANHQYDLTDFSTALAAGNLPAVSFLQAAAYQDGHAAFSDPLDEQQFLVDTINAIVKSPDWSSTAIVLTYDDAGGWYDHQQPAIANGSNDSDRDTALCTGVAIALGTANDRCGYAGRVPLLVISPYAPANTVSHVATDQTSILRFIEDNWLGGQRIGNGSFDALAGPLSGTDGLLNFSAKPHADQLVLDPTTGAVVSDTLPTDVLLPGTKIQLSDTSGPVSRRNYVALRDGAQPAPLPDPRVTGATASIGRVGAGEVTVLDLPASGWSGSSSTGDYKFKSRSGAVVAARLDAGRSIRLSARGNGAYPLGGTPQGGVGVIVDVGGVRFCAFFGGTIVKDDGVRFRARKAPAPANCPLLGTTSTTSTTTPNHSAT